MEGERDGGRERQGERHRDREREIWREGEVERVVGRAETNWLIKHN